MKRLIIGLFFVSLAIFTPNYARADFDPAQLIDPFCWFACDDDEPQEVHNTYTNSNNVNSNVNSPGAVVNNSGNTGGNQNSDDYYNDDDYYDDYDYEPHYPPITVTCYASDTRIEVGDRITWTAYPHGGNGDYYVTWDGTNGLDGEGTSVVKRYNSPGTKNASVTVKSAGKTLRKNCETVVVYEDRDDYYDDDYYYDDDDYYDYDDDYYYRNLYVTCRANTTFAPVGTRVVWEAIVSGGSGNYRYDWDGSEGLRGSSRSISYSYNNPGTKSAQVEVRSGSRRVTAHCTNYVTVGVPIQNYNPAPVYYPPVTYQTPAPQKVVVERVVEKKVEVPVAPTSTPIQYASSLFSLENVPWGWVAVLVIIVLLITVIYLIVNRPKI